MNFIFIIFRLKGEKTLLIISGKGTIYTGFTKIVFLCRIIFMIQY